jgi:hypothetical protein
MDQRPIPKGLERLSHYLESESVAWDKARLGTSVVVVAHDSATEQPGSFEFELVATQTERNDLTTSWVELRKNDFTFVEGGQRSPVKLPAGTIMKGGVSCQHFPETNAFMSYLGGLSVNRDFSFDEVMTPDGRIIGTILVPQITGLFSFLPEDGYTPPESLVVYQNKIAEWKLKEESEYDKAVREMDETIAARVVELFEIPETREELLALIATFHPEARWRLAVLLDYAKEDGVQDNYLSTLKLAIIEEFDMAPPGLRGVSILPASQRGWSLMVRELGLSNPRPQQ